jgi:endonuclease/exonuclease/phosphatase family metal-dependent hydrolase
MMPTLMRWLAIAAAVAALIADVAPAAAATLRVMTFNVRVPLAQDGPNAWPNRKSLLGDVVARARPDIIATQELKKEQGDYLIDRFPGYAWFGSDRRGGDDDEHMGIFYRRDRLRIVELGNFWLSDTPRVPGSISWGHPYPRMVTWGLFEAKADGRRFYVYNTHLPYRAEDEPARTKGAQAIAAHIASLPADVPLILAGDFNTVPGSPTYAALDEALDDVRTTTASLRGPEATYHAFTGKADRRIDWIFVRGFKPVSVATDATRRGNVYPSDHYPVVAELRW